MEDSDDDDICRASEPKTASAPGVIKRLLSLFSRRKIRKQSRRTPVDRASHRKQAYDLLKLLQGGQTGDVSARLVLLRGLSAKLDELFRQLVAAGDRDPSVKELGEAVLRLHTLLSQSQPAETEVLAVWARIEKCLQHWLALGETTESPRREGFWK